MQSCSSCALGTVSHCPKTSLRFKPLLKETVLKFSWISSALLSGSPLLVRQLCCGHVRWVSWSLHRHTLRCVLPSRSWGQRSRLSPKSCGLASDGYVRWSRPTAQWINMDITRGPLLESPVSPGTLSWGWAWAWGAFPPLLTLLVQSCFCLSALLLAALPPAFSLVGEFAINANWKIQEFVHFVRRSHSLNTLVLVL